MAGDLNFKVNFDTAQAGAELQGLLEKFVAGSEAAGNKLNRALGGTIERKVVIRTEVDEAGVKKLTSQVVTLRSEADKLKNAFASATRVDRGSITSLRQQINQATQARDAIKQFGQAIDLTNRKQVLSAKQTQEFIDADNKVKILQQSLRNLQDADKGLSGRLASSFGDLLEKGRKLQDIVTIFQSIGIAIGAVTGPIKAATNALADLDQFRLSFQAIGQGADASNGALADASRIALGLGVNVKTVREGFQQLSPVVLNTGGSLNDVSAITESLSSRFAAFGLSTEKSRRVLNGIIQAFGKGKLQAEELTQQISEADPAFKTDLTKALFAARNELGALGKEVDGTTANLEQLVKDGKITAEVLRKIIPELSKSEILFGKLGPTASSAVEAFRRGRQGLDAIPVTLRQVQANIENINQLNLEKFARLAEPLVVVFLDIQAAITDLITRIADTGAIKDFITILSSIGSAISNLIKLLSAGAEGILQIVSAFTPLITALTKVPGLVEVLGLILLTKLKKPALETIQTIKGLNNAVKNIANANLGTVGDVVPDPKKSKVSQKAIEAVRAELEKPARSGVAEAAAKSERAIRGLSETSTTLTRREITQSRNLQREIKSLGAERRAIIQNISQLESDRAAAGAATAARSQTIEGIRAQITELERLQRQARTTAQGLRNFYLQQANASGLGQEFRNPQLRDQIFAADAEVDRLGASLDTLRNQLDDVGRVRVSPEIDLTTDFDAEINTARGRLDELDTEIRTRAKRLAKIQIKPGEVSELVIPTAQIDEAANLTKRYKDEALRAYAAAKQGSSGLVGQLEEEVKVLRDRRDLLKSSFEQRRTSKQAAGFQVAVGAEGEIDILRQIESQLSKTETELNNAREAYANYVAAGNDVTAVQEKLAAGTKLTSAEFSQLVQVNAQASAAYRKAQADLGGIGQAQKDLADRIKATGQQLAATSYGSRDAERLRTQLNGLKQEAQGLEQRYNATATAANRLGAESDAAFGALGKATQARGKLQGLKDGFEELSKSSNRFASGFGRLGLGIIGTAGRIGESIRKIGLAIKAIGTEVLIFAAFSTAVAAYSKATEAANRVQEENKNKLEALKSTVSDLESNFNALAGAVKPAADVEGLIPKFNGLEVVLISLGGVIKGIIDLFKRLFDNIKGGVIDPITGKVQQAASGFEQLASALLVVGAGIATGFQFGKVWGAAIGGTIALVSVLTAKFNSAGVAIDQIKQKGQAAREGYQQEFDLLGKLVTQINRYGTEYLKVKAITDKAGTGAAQADLTKQAGLFAKITVAYQQLQTRASALNTELQTNQQQFTILSQKAAALQAEISKRESTRTGTTEELDALRVQLEATKAASGELKVAEELLKSELEGLEAKIEKLRQKYGLLSKEQLENANNLSNLNAKLKEAKSALELLDFDSQRKQFDNVATSIGVIQAQVERLESAAKSRELAGYVSEVKKQLADGTIPTSLANIEKLVKALEERSINLDITSPELPKVLQDLLKAEQFVNELDGKKAQITLELIDKGLKEGTLKDTLALREKQLEQLGKVKQSSPINSAEYQQALEAEKKLTDQKKADEMSIDELRASIADKQKERIDNIAQAEKAAHDRKMDQLDREKEKVEKLYDAQIKAAEGQRGPAEQELDNLKRQELIQKSQKGGRDGLEARAELERLKREEEVAKLKEQKEAKLAEIAEKKAAAEEENRKKEETLLQQRLAVEATIAAIRGKSIDQELATLQNALNQRQSALGKAPGAESLVPGGSGQAVVEARKAGEQAGQAYSDGYTMIIKRADTPQNDPNAKVKYDYQDPKVIASQKERNQLEAQYQALLQSTRNLEQQGQGAGQLDPATSNQILANYQQLTALQNQIAQSEQNYSNALQATKTITGEIVINNQSLAQSFGQIAQQQPAKPVDIAALTAAYNSSKLLTSEYNAQNRIIQSLKTQLAGANDPSIRTAIIEQLKIENQKLGEIGQKAKQANTAYSGLQQQAKAAGQNFTLPEGLDKLKQEIQGFASGLSNSTQQTQSTNDALQSAAQESQALGQNAATAAAAFTLAGQAVSQGILPSLQQVTPQLNDIQSQMNAIFDRDYSIDVALNVKRQGLWTGGPTTAGTVYKVNELGQEGFMNRSGRVTPINKARNSLWRAPGDGFVIPADIYSQMTATGVTAPTTGVSHRRPRVAGGVDPIRTVAKMTAALAAKMAAPQSNAGLSELAKVQVYQAQEIGRLSRAVQELNEKDWNVNVKVRNNNNLAYLKALNHRL